MLPTTEPATHGKLGARLAARLPEILIQALFMLVAVVLAFAIEEWREEREFDHIANEARVALVQEVEHNRDELLESRQDMADTIALLETALASPALPEAPALVDIKVGFELALLSSAAWRSAQSMDVARRMDYGWMLQVARAYELQAMFEQAQWSAVAANTTFQAAGDEASRAAGARELLARMRLLAFFSKSLEGDYADILAD